ncbi:TonB-linked outer membrane protein, SusC/RagA family [Chitinophaga costaii]|uniref:TonB-linked outer membrane protein, SusC/RagA family n=1 Tax=Chitinophaga costaii TaxID=1335309 RepID=A0A1C4FTU5_9BACT|nr:TonB-dependent receptor [Chitinophaga costaii]PUZ27314.1 TonB-dependent receptor [Chitinophaga costaii]SCC59296.1 TonB-linked outer membrane protein, SusC/RagA family [Chitinophaga costaii]
MIQLPISRMRYGLLLLCCMLSSMAIAQHVVQGTVTDASQQPVIGASVHVKGMHTGTQTDVGGAFSIQANKGDFLEISFIGFNTQTVAIGDSAKLKVILQPSSTSLNEVVATGYSSQRKKDITGSVSVVNITNLKSVPSGTTESLLQGQSSGVTVINSGNPGGGSQVNIRGISTIGNSSPLVIVDGVPGSLHDLNVNDIESMQVLKDAGSASIYGVRGSNGVIVVTTKKGKQGKTQVSYDGYYGVQVPLSKGFGLAGTKTYMDAIFAMQQNSGNTPSHPQFGTGTFSIPDYILPAGAKAGDAGTDPSTYNINTHQIMPANKSGTDWFHEIFRHAPIQSHNITASGGSEKNNFLVSLGYFDQQGTLINTYLKRYSVRVNSSFTTGHLRIGENVYLVYKDNPKITNQNEGNAISYAYREPPIIPVYDIMGNFAGTKAPGLGNSQNPVAVQKRTANNRGYDWQINGNIFAELDVWKHRITLRSSVGGNLDNYYFYGFTATPYEAAEGNTAANNFQETGGFSYGRTFTNTITYNQQFGHHDVKVLAGTEAIKNYGRGMFGGRNSYTLSTDPDYITLNTGLPSSATNGVYQLYSNTLYSQFARIDYNYNSKYLLSGTLRRDGSSFFAPGHQYGVFPSVTAGWRLSQEPFMAGLHWLNDLKLRGGYGELGSLSGVSTQPNNAYSLYAADPAKSYYDLAGTGFNPMQGTYNSQLGNLITTWESDAIANLGFDATLFNNRLDLSFEVYKKKISGLLFQQALLATAGGASAPYINGGNIENKGFDFNATYHGNVQDAKFDIGLNLSHYTSMVVSLPHEKYQDFYSAGSSRLGTFVRLQPGHALGSFFGYQVEGLFRDAEDVSKSPKQTAAAPGRFKYRDETKDGMITDADRTFFGNPNPKLTGGFNLSVSYHHFDFNMFLYGSYGNKVVNYVRYWTDFPQVFGGAVAADVISNSWRPDNLNAKIPVLETSANFSNTGAFNSFYLEDGSYLKMKSLTLGYTLPDELIKRLRIQRLRVYVLASNLFTITKYSGLDPELQNANLNDNTSFGIDFGDYPANQKNYNIGLNVTF